MLTRTVIFFACMVLTVRAENLLVNGDFEQGATNFSSDYVYSGGNLNTEGFYAVVHSPRNGHPHGADFPDHTSGLGLMLAANGGPDSSKAVWRQSVAVKPYKDYVFSGWASSWGMSNWSTNLTDIDACPPVMVVTINGVECGNVVQVPATNGVWLHFMATWHSQNSSQAQIAIRLATTAVGGNDVAMDDLGFYPAGSEQTPLEQILSESSTSTTTPTPNATRLNTTGVYTSTNLVSGVQILRAVEITWPSLANQIYQVQSSSALDTGAWIDLGNPVMGNGTTNSVFDEMTQPNRYYRVLSFE